MIYEEIFREFEARRVRYLVVGGIAVNLYSYVRMTMDLDIMTDLSSENLAKIIDGMEKLGYRPRLLVQALELVSEEQRNLCI